MLAKATLKELAKKINPSSRVLMRTDYNVPIKNNKIEDLKTQGYSFEQARKIQELEAEILEYQKKLAEQFVINDLLKKHHGLKSSAHVKSASGLTDTIRQLGPNKKPRG